MKHLKQTTKKTLGQELISAIKEALENKGRGELTRPVKKTCRLSNNKQ